MSNDLTVREQVLDINQSFLVQAPAGSGKTSILVQRFLTALAHAKQGPEEIIAITFTRKAAAEMKDRILNALQMAAQDYVAQNPYEAKMILLAKLVLERDKQAGWHLLDNPARLKIQTIDSLCASITQQMPILSRFGAQPQVETNPIFLYQKAVDLLLQSLEQTSEWNDSLCYILAHLDNDRIKVKKLLVDMLAIRDQWLPTIAGDLHEIDMRKYLEHGLELARAETLNDLIDAVPDILDYSLLPIDQPETVEDWDNIAAILLTTEGTWRRQVNIKQGFEAPSAGKDKAEKQRLKDRKDAMHAMLDQLAGYEDFRLQLLAIQTLPPAQYNDTQWNIVESLVVVLPVLVAQLTLVFRDSGKVDFTEIALAALHALAAEGAPSDLILALDCKIQHILVDEFQDTSHTQFRLLERLTANWDDNDGRTLFLVGDPMQSIYRFRQAEVGLFLKAKQQGLGNIRLNFRQLNTNFRSSANVMQWINRVFAQSFPPVDHMTLGAISYMPAYAAEVAVPSCNAIECINVKADYAVDQIIDIIRNTKDHNPEYSIAVLVRAKSHLLDLLPALRQAGIEFQGIEIEGLAARPLIQDLLALTQALLHLDDRIAWLAILRAPWCGLDLATLHSVTQKDKTIWQVLQTLQNPRVQRFNQVLNIALNKLGRLSIVQVVKETWLELGGLECLRTDDELLEAEEFFALLAKYAHDRMLYEPDFLSLQLNQLYLPSVSTNRSAVQIMTIHKAKGLEFDVVILPGLEQNIKNDDQQLLLLDARDYFEQYLLLAPIRAAIELEDPIYAYLAWCEKQRQAYETLRLFYVATTRARKQIYCLAEIPENEKVAGMLGKIWSAVQHEFKQTDIATTTVIEKNHSLRRLPQQWFAENPYNAKILETKNIDFNLPQQDWLRIAGVVMHRMLWRIATIGCENFGAEYIQQLPQIIQKSLRALQLQTNHAAAEALIMQAITNMLSDEFGKTILSGSHPEAYAEWRLTKPYQDECEQIILDRVFIDQDRNLWLVDYKLIQSADDISAAINVYDKQIFKYRNALVKIKPGYNIIAGLYFPLQKRWHAF
jgi:ATP-dependent exoDNAse (exonuclease V) beta subunit